MIISDNIKNLFGKLFDTTKNLPRYISGTCKKFWKTFVFFRK